MKSNEVYRLYLPNRYWIFKGEHEFKVNERDEELLLGKYDNYTFPIVYKEAGGCRYFMKTNHGGRNFAVSDEVVDIFIKKQHNRVEDISCRSVYSRRRIDKGI